VQVVPSAPRPITTTKTATYQSRRTGGDGSAPAAAGA
jgi:hypothetical protein